MYVGGEQEVVSQELGKRAIQYLRWGRETLTSHLAWGCGFKSSWVGFGLMTSYVISDFLRGSRH